MTPSSPSTSRASPPRAAARCRRTARSRAPRRRRPRCRRRPRHPAAESARSRRAAYGAPEAPVIPRKTFTAPGGAATRRRPRPSTPRGRCPSSSRFSSPRFANEGMTVLPNWPGWRRRRRTPRRSSRRRRSRDRSGAPRLLTSPRRGTCGSSCSPTPRRGSRPATPSSERPWSSVHSPTSSTFSEASASLAVAPLYVRTPIEAMTRSAATTATGRRSEPPLAAAVDERQRRTAGSARASGSRPCRGSTDSGHLKIRSR